MSESERERGLIGQIETMVTTGREGASHSCARVTVTDLGPEEVGFHDLGAAPLGLLAHAAVAVEQLHAVRRRRAPLRGQPTLRLHIWGMQCRVWLVEGIKTISLYRYIYGNSIWVKYMRVMCIWVLYIVMSLRVK